MANSQNPVFPHRRNADSTFDSICIRCFQTIATSHSEADLKAGEDAHVCPGLDLVR
jgi:hypothetical protein